MQVIQKLTVVSNPTRIFEVGTEFNGREVIEIEQIGVTYEDHIHSEYVVKDENGDLISSVENCPVILDYKQIAEHDEDYENEK